MQVQMLGQHPVLVLASSRLYEFGSRILGSVRILAESPPESGCAKNRLGSQIARLPVPPGLIIFSYNPVIRLEYFLRDPSCLVMDARGKKSTNLMTPKMFTN